MKLRMRYCNQCHRMTVGEPLFCNFCGRSYDLKLCSSRHVNPRSAEICSQCGSRDLSTPHPKVPLFFAILLAVLPFFPGLILLGLTILFAISFIEALLTRPDLQFQFLLVALMFGFVWYLYLHLPAFLRHWIAKRLHKTKKDDHGH